MPEPADTADPSVSITAPADGATVAGSVALAASASDNIGVTSVEFRVDGTLLSDTTAPVCGDLGRLERHGRIPHHHRDRV